MEILPIETITAAKRPQRMPQPLPKSKLHSFGLSTAWSQRNPTFENLCCNYSPANWHYAARLAEECYTRECPALVALNEIYGNRDAAKVWVEIQITRIFNDSAEKDEGMAQIIPMFAENFCAEAGRFKLLELMLFFSRLAAGRYRTYGKFDPKQIGNIFWTTFQAEREKEMDIIRLREEEQHRQEWQTDADRLTLAEWKSYEPFKAAGYDLEFWRKYRSWLASWWWGAMRNPREPHLQPI